MGFRLAMRQFAIRAPYKWLSFATPFKSNNQIVGATFFRDYAERTNTYLQGPCKNIGLIDSFLDLESERFDPTRVHPTIRDFYEKTTHFDMKITVNWNPIIRPLGVLFQNLVAKRIQQLIIPMDNEVPVSLDSWIELISVDNGEHDFRCWIRVLQDSRRPVYVGAYKTYKSTLDGYSASYVCVAFPIPAGNIVTVLTPLNLDSDGLLLTTSDRLSTEAGMYLILPHDKSFSMLPAFGLSERFQLRPNMESSELAIDVLHDSFWLGIFAFRMRYRITYSRHLEDR